jgi:hypothetical protein
MLVGGEAPGGELAASHSSPLGKARWPLGAWTQRVRNEKGVAAWGRGGSEEEFRKGI